MSAVGTTIQGYKEEANFYHDDHMIGFCECTREFVQALSKINQEFMALVCESLTAFRQSLRLHQGSKANKDQEIHHIPCAIVQHPLKKNVLPLPQKFSVLIIPEINENAKILHGGHDTRRTRRRIHVSIVHS